MLANCIHPTVCLPASADSISKRFPENTANSSKTSWQEQKEAQARRRKRQNDLKKTEDRIAELEDRDGVIDRLMEQEEVYTNSVRCQELAAEKAEIAQELEELYEKWEELAE